MPLRNPTTEPNQRSTGDPIPWQQSWLQHASWLRTVIAVRMDSTLGFENPHVDEVLQNVAIQAWKKQEQLAKVEKMGPWLYRIAVQQVNLFFRERTRQGKRTESLERDKFESLDGNVQDPLETLTREEIHQQVRDSIQCLPQGQREVLLLKHTEGWTYQQLADHLGLTVDKIIYRVGKAQESLRRQLAKCKKED